MRFLSARLFTERTFVSVQTAHFQGRTMLAPIKEEAL